MSDRDWKILFEDILSSIEKCERYTEKLTFEDFTTQSIVIDAVVRNLEIIGEAAKRIPSTIQIQYNAIPWRKIIGLRNRVIHEYFGVDISVIWFIVQNELSMLKEEVRKVLSDIK